MDTLSLLKWNSFAGAAAELDWPRASRELAEAKPLHTAWLAFLDRIRESVFEARQHGDSTTKRLLDEKLVSALAAEQRTGDAAADFAEEVFAGAMELYIRTLKSANWPGVPTALSRILSVPRHTRMQDVAVEGRVADLIDLAASIEQKFPADTLATDELSRLPIQAKKIEERLLSEMEIAQLDAVAESCRLFIKNEDYERVAADVMLNALGRLHWPTLRRMKFLISAKLPAGRDRRWPAVLRRQAVRYVTLE
jgi:hypothetical protein